MNTKPLVSVVIPVFNEEKHIQQCLDSLLTQTYHPIEVIVIDDGSTDRTKTILKAFPEIKKLNQSHKGAGSARNLGARKAKGTILVFVDADMTFAPDFIDKLTLPIRKDNVVGTFSNQEMVANWDKPWAKAWGRLRGFVDGRMHTSTKIKTQPVFRAITKTAFDKVGGFDTEAGYDDDWSLAAKLGQPAVAAPGAKFYHFNPDTLGEMYTQARWMASRKYKWNLIGRVLNLLKVLFPVTFVKSIVLTIKYRQLNLLIATWFYDAGTFWGLIFMTKAK